MDVMSSSVSELGSQDLTIQLLCTLVENKEGICFVYLAMNSL
jgi:hypothetical protein